MRRKNPAFLILIGAYIIFISVSWIIGFTPGKEISRGLATFSLEMIKIVPVVFILIGLFEMLVNSSPHSQPEQEVHDALDL